MIAVNKILEIIAWNPAAERLWGHTTQEQVGKFLNQIDFFGLESEVCQRASRTIEKGMVEQPVRLSFDRDQAHHILLTVFPLRPPASPAEKHSESPPEGAILIAENVSEKIEHEIAAKILGQYQRALSASLPVPLMVADTENRVMSWNAAAGQLFNISEQDALGKEVDSLTLPQAPCSTFPFSTPDGTQRGTLHIYGDSASVFTPQNKKPSGNEARSGSSPAPAKTLESSMVEVLETSS